HHLLPANAVVDDEVLERLDLDDDNVSAASGAERGATAAAKRRPVDKPDPGFVDLLLGRSRTQQCRARVGPRIVRVIAVRAELLDEGAVAERLIDPACGKLLRRR